MLHQLRAAHGRGGGGPLRALPQERPEADAGARVPDRVRVRAARRELDHFEAWIINPNDDLSKVELVPENTTRIYNEKVYRENCRHRKLAPMGPPLPADDEKVTEVVEEKLDL